MPAKDTSLADEIKDLTASDESELTPRDARIKAMDYLARREHAHAELLRKLCKVGFSVDMADNAIRELTRDGLQSDQRFVEAFVQSRFSAGKGPVRIRAEIREREVDDGLLLQAMRDFSGDWSALACEVRLKKFGPRMPIDFKEKARQMRFLQYRGFEQEQILDALGDD